MTDYDELAPAESPTDLPAPSPPRSPRRRVRLRWLVLILVLGWSAYAGLSLWRAGRLAQEGAASLQELRDQADPASLLRGEGLPQMEAAGRSFSEAHDLAQSPLLSPLRILPVIGRQLDSVRSLTGAASTVAHAGVASLREFRSAIDSDTKSGPQRVELMRRIHRIANEALGAVAATDLGPTRALIGPLATGLVKFDHQRTRLLEELALVRDGSAGMIDFLSGPSHYVLLAANNGEMRAGSGMLLSAGQIDVVDGSLHVGDMRSVIDLRLPAGTVAVPPTIDALWGWTGPSQEWRNLAMTPRFDITGQMAVEMWKAKTGQTVDGVIVTDPFALQAMLAATGPVELDGQTISADNIIDDLLLNQYRSVGVNGRSGVDADNDARRQRLSQINQAVFQRVQDGKWDVAKMIQGMQAAVSGHHLMAWSSKTREQQGWRAAGMTGELTTSSLALSILSQGGNKLDQFLDVNAHIARAPHDEATDDVTVTVDVHNRAPIGLPFYVAGPSQGATPGAGSPEGVYKGIVTLNVPGAATGLAVDGGASPLVSGPDGPTRMIARRITLPRDQTVTMVFTFRVPRDQPFSVPSSGRPPSLHWTAAGLDWWAARGTTDVKAIEDSSR